MQIKSKIELSLQILIIFACLFTLLNQFSIKPATAQGGIINCSGMIVKDPVNPQRFSWKPITPSINLVIYDTPNPVDFSRIEAGIRSWSGISPCCDINFNQATSGTRGIESNDTIANSGAGNIPNNTMWVVRAYHTQMHIEYANFMSPSQYVRAGYMHYWTEVTSTSSPNVTFDYMKGLAAHETGHTFGFWNGHTALAPYSILSGSHVIQTPGYCDIEKVSDMYCPTTPTPTPTPTPLPPPIIFPPIGCQDPTVMPLNGMCPINMFASNKLPDWCCSLGNEFPGGEGGFGNCDTSGLSAQCMSDTQEYCACREYAGFYDPDFCQCYSYSPIVIDIQGNGFDLSSAEDGVDFDMFGDGTPDTLAWTSANSDDAFLVLDRNRNGTIDNGAELFGNFTPQPNHPEKNGFLALAVYDEISHEGNGDGVINNKDVVFSNLRLWQDKNHNGISEQSELFRLPDLNVDEIELDYKTSKKTDEHDNKFRYRAKVRDAKKAKVGRWAWDVFFATPR